MAVFLGKYESGSPEWLALRAGANVSGTLVGTVNGLNPWESAFTAWAKATGRIPDEVKQTLRMRAGQLLEPVAKQLWLEQNPGYELDGDVGTWAHPQFEWAVANPDGFLLWPDGKGGILEIKTTTRPYDELPAHYRAQVLWYMWVMNMIEKPAKVVVLVAGSDLQEFDVEWDNFEFEALLAGVNRWRESVLADVKPGWDGSESTFATVKKLNEGITDATEDLGELGVHLSNAQATFDEAETFLRELKSRTLDAMGDAKYGVSHGVTVAVRAVNKNGVVSLTVKKGS